LCRHLYRSCGSAKHRYMVGLPCLVSQCAKLHVAGRKWAVFTRVYLESCTWPVAIFTMDMRKSLLTLQSSLSSFWRNTQLAVIYHPPCFPDLVPCDLFLFPKIKLKLKRRPVWYHWRNPGPIEESPRHSDRKWLQGILPKMEETVRPVSTCGRELFRE
jgi:hypothetical protein